MKKCKFYTVSAVALLIMAVLVMGCLAGTPEPDYQPPAGKGAVRLNFNETTRSIIPGTSLSSFVKFDIEFQAVTGGAVTDTSHTNVPAGSVEGPYDLNPGTYDIVVIGYTALGDAATGQEDGVAIIAGKTTDTPTIYLESYNPATATGTGTFSWTITNNITGTITLATINFTNRLC